MMYDVLFYDDKIETRTTFTAEYNDCIIVIKMFRVWNERRDVMWLYPPFFVVEVQMRYEPNKNGSPMRFVACDNSSNPVCRSFLFPGKPVISRLCGVLLCRGDLCE